MAGMPADARRPSGVEITSPANPRIKDLIALRRRRQREQSAVTLVEGMAEIQLALAAGVRPRALYYSQELSPAGATAVAHSAAERGAEIVRLSRPVFEKVSV